MRSYRVMVILVINLLCLLVLSLGMYAAFHTETFGQAAGLVESGPKKTVQKEKNSFFVVGLGDSLTTGSGDEEGKGYFYRVIDRLKEQQKLKVSYANYAVNGLETSGLIPMLDQKGTQASIKKADAVFLTIGGNDLFPEWSALTEKNPQVITPDTKTFKKNMQAIFTKIQEINPDATVYWIGLYNPFEEIKQFGDASKLVQLWNGESQQVALDYNQVIFVPIFDLFKGRTKATLYIDYFHPNGTGYKLIADRLYQNVNAQIEIRLDGGL